MKLKKIFVLLTVFLLFICGCEKTGKSEAGTCVISVSCKSVFENKNSVSESILSALPDNGIILSETEVEFIKGESAFNVLYKALKEEKIHFEYSETPFYKSVYIEGISGLYEFDAGELSGWLYCVNGEFPTFGCSDYYVKAGDEIEFLYTCDRGKGLNADIK